VLDVGCAKGYLVKMLRDRKIEAWGVDVSEYAIENAPEDVRFYLNKINVEDEPLPFFDRFFRLVVSIATFEHLDLRRSPFFLSEINRVLEPNGILMINVPNPLNKTETEKPEHKTVINMKKWIELIEKSGFRYEPSLSRLFEALRVEEIVALYILTRRRFQFMHLCFHFPRKMKTLVAHLMILKRKLLPLNNSLVFRRL